MSNVSVSEDAINRLATQAAAAGKLAQDSGAFAATVAAFESQDPNAFRWVLERIEMLPYCELLCEWVRVKVCVLRCIRVCGPPLPDDSVPNLKEFAQAAVHLASNEKLLRRAVDAVSCGDGDDFKAVLQKLQLSNFCHELCHWICSIIYRSVCYRVCEPGNVTVADPANEMQATSKVLSTVLANEKAFNAINEAAVALNCETLQSTIGQAGLLAHCEILCFFICTWRCGWVCREFCTVNQPITGVYDIEEARTFALATRQLATQPRALGDLLAAVQSRDAKAFAEIITNYRLGPYCMQVCAWVCSQVCYSYCTCVCPNPALDPWFYLVGNFDIYTQINPTSGRTNVSLPGPPSGMPWGGGPNFAFQGQLQLGGWCPAYSPAFPSDLMQYRFLYATASTTLAVAITAGDTSIGVSSSSGIPSGSFNALLCTPTESPETGEIINVTGVSGTTWTVSRGQDGTTAISAPAGSTLWINLQPITNNLVDLPLLVGQKNVLWPPLAGGGLAGPGLVPTPEQVYVGYGTDATMPASGAPYGLGPTHYIKPDVATGWIAVDPAVTGEGFKNLLNFDTTRLLPANCPLPGSAPCWGPCFGTPGGAPAGTAVPPANQGAGTDLAIIFQATRVTVSTVDYSNSLCKIHVNNWCEVNNLWFAEFGSGGCCNPIDTSLSVEFTVDHEEMDAGAWTLSINSCPSGSAPGDITPHVSSPGPPAVTVTPRGGSGTIIENTTTWSNCSYTVSLNTRPGLTSGLIDRDWVNNQLTFCICGHNATTLAAAIDATQTSINTTSSAGFPPTPFSVTVGGTGEVMTVNTMSGTMWTVLRGQSGTTAAPALAGATLTET